jgi:hypothetical protein
MILFPSWVLYIGYALFVGGVVVFAWLILGEAFPSTAPARPGWHRHSRAFADWARRTIAHIAVIGGLVSAKDEPCDGLGILETKPTSTPTVYLPKFLPEPLAPGNDSPLTTTPPSETDAPEPFVIDDEAFHSGFTMGWPTAAAIVREAHAKAGAR